MTLKKIYIQILENYLIKDVLHLSVSLADQEEYIMSVLEEHIEDIKNGI